MHVRTVAGAVRALLLAEGLFVFAAYAALGLLELLAVALRGHARLAGGGGVRRGRGVDRGHRPLGALIARGR